MPQPLHILHVGKFYPPHHGGMESHLETLCRELTPGHKLSVVVSSEDRCSTSEVRSQVPVTRAATWLNLAAAPITPGLRTAIRSAQADIVHLHWPNPAAVLAWLAAGAPGRLVITYHSDVIRQKHLDLLFRPVLEAALRRASAIIVTSPNYAVSSPVVSRFLDRTHVIPFGIELGQFENTNPALSAELRQRYGPRLLLAAGRMVYYKGFTHLLQALPGTSARVILVGGGPLRGALEAEAAALGIADRVCFAGEVPDLVPYYHACDAFVLPSIARSEAFGIVQMEALACGKPVLNTALDSGVPYVSLHEVTGLTTPPGDPDALAAAINRILGDDALRERLGRQARLRAESEFKLETMIRRTVALYEQIARLPKATVLRPAEPVCAA
jgi:glycosyltransferase involved in cell wall biosynthesis